MEKWYGKQFWVRFGLFATSIAVMLLILPRDDHQTFNYSVNQPWKYSLLTAEFDVKVYPDSVASQAIRDSIDNNFVPFVRHLTQIPAQNINEFKKAVKDSIPAKDIALLSDLMEQVYRRGVMEDRLSANMQRIRKNEVRFINAKDTTVIFSKDASEMLSMPSAIAFIDSVYGDHYSHDTVRVDLPPFVANALHTTLDANYIIDTYNDKKFRDREYADISENFGMIKDGQRIVDKGEIVTPQIYNNLNNYLEQVELRDESGRSQAYFDLGRLLVVMLVMLCLFLFLWNYRRSFYESFNKMAFLLSYITFFVIFAVLMFEYVRNGLSIVPFAAVPVVVLIFFDSRTAIISLLVTVLICSLFATFPFQFIIMQILAGIVATTSISQLTKRSQLLQTALYTFVVYSIAYVGLELAVNGASAAISPKFFGYYAINSVILSFAYVLILIIEKIFGFTSNVTLVELSDINNPILRRLAREAPGTFQHSLQVSTLAAEAASAIGANTLLVRTGALYHDIGKLECPIYFTENQHGFNPHESLTPEESAKKILGHISCGIKLAKQNNLPKSIKDFIREHHGRGIAKYFYFTAANERGQENVSKEDFEYPGPNPQTKETAVLMMADSVEAASRSLKEYTPDAISGLVNKIIDGQLADGLFKEAPISFRDIDTVKKVFINRLSTMYHTRVAYPELNKKQN